MLNIFIIIFLIPIIILLGYIYYTYTRMRDVHEFIKIAYPIVRSLREKVEARFESDKEIETLIKNNTKDLKIIFKELEMCQASIEGIHNVKIKALEEDVQRLFNKIADLKGDR